MLVFILMFFNIQAQALTIACTFSKDVDIKNKETMLKTYVYEYWNVASKEISQLPIGLQKKGFVVGDFQFNNVGIYFDYSKAKSELVINDFDDSGFNYLLGDLLKFISYIKRVDSDADLDALIDSYIQGLQGRSITVPGKIAAVMNQSQYQFSHDYMKYVESRVIETSEFDVNSLTNLQQANLRHFMGLRLLKKLVDVKPIVRVNNTGSSSDMERYEFTGTDSNGAIGVIEFKQLKCSGTGASQNQDLQNSFAQVKSFFQKNFPSSYTANQQIYDYNSNFYLVREKKNNPLKKLALDKLGKGQIQVYTNFFANFLGSIHAKSADAAYVNGIQSNKDDLKKISKKIATQFKKEIKD